MKELKSLQSGKPPQVAESIAAIFGCKWSLRILALIRSGVVRPGAIERALPGLTTRVQSYYFARLLELGVLQKTSFPEVPPRVEYNFTKYGRAIMPILDSIEALQTKLESKK